MSTFPGDGLERVGEFLPLQRNKSRYTGTDSINMQASVGCLIAEVARTWQAARAG